MKKLIIFDLDGTLADTQPLLFHVFTDALCDCGFPVTYESVCKMSAGNNYSPVNGGYTPNDYLDRVPANYGEIFWANYDNYFIKAADRLFDGIRETLDELKSRGYTVTVLSNKPHRYTYPIIMKAFGEGYFELVEGGSDKFAKKPAPDGILYVCEKLGFAPADAYMIGDLPADYRAAKAAGANFIAAGWGYGLEELKKEGADIIAAKPEDIAGNIVASE